MRVAAAGGGGIGLRAMKNAYRKSDHIALAPAMLVAVMSVIAGLAGFALPAAAAPPAAAPVAPAGANIPPPPDVAAPPADAETTSSGLASKVLVKGSGSEHPLPSDKVKVHYSGWTTDGKMFDSSVARGRPAVFPLDKVISGWTEGVALMVVGEKRRLWIPEKLAYAGRTDRPQGMLVFDVELLEIVK